MLSSNVPRFRTNCGGDVKKSWPTYLQIRNVRPSERKVDFILRDNFDVVQCLNSYPSLDFSFSSIEYFQWNTRGTLCDPINGITFYLNRYFVCFILLSVIISSLTTF